MLQHASVSLHVPTKSNECAFSARYPGHMLAESEHLFQPFTYPRTRIPRDASGRYFPTLLRKKAQPTLVKI
jgi:hypothetical protein